MAQAGEVIGAQIVHNSETGQDRVYGIVDFADQAAAQSAIDNLNGSMFQGRVIRVKLASDPGHPEFQEC